MALEFHLTSAHFLPSLCRCRLYLKRVAGVAANATMDDATLQQAQQLAMTAYQQELQRPGNGPGAAFTFPVVAGGPSKARKLAAATRRASGGAQQQHHHHPKQGTAAAAAAAAAQNAGSGSSSAKSPAAVVGGHRGGAAGHSTAAGHSSSRPYPYPYSYNRAFPYAYGQYSAAAVSATWATMCNAQMSPQDACAAAGSGAAAVGQEGSPGINLGSSDPEGTADDRLQRSASPAMEEAAAVLHGLQFCGPMEPKGRSPPQQAPGTHNTPTAVKEEEAAAAAAAHHDARDASPPDAQEAAEDRAQAYAAQQSTWSPEMIRMYYANMQAIATAGAAPGASAATKHDATYPYQSPNNALDASAQSGGSASLAAAAATANVQANAARIYYASMAAATTPASQAEAVSTYYANMQAHVAMAAAGSSAATTATNAPAADGAGAQRSDLLEASGSGSGSGSPPVGTSPPAEPEAGSAAGAASCSGGAGGGLQMGSWPSWSPCTWAQPAPGPPCTFWGFPIHSNDDSLVPSSNRA